jgi:surface antigen
VSRRSLKVAAAVVLVTATLLPGAGVAAQMPRPSPIVYGYPYANRCPGAGIAEQVDRWGMYTCNCTSYVAWALTANDQRTGWFIRGSMDAWNWPNVARLSALTVRRTPVVGAVAVWPKLGKLGHVAYVSAVHSDGTFDVGEYNLPLFHRAQTFDFDVRYDVSRVGAVFVVVPRR